MKTAISKTETEMEAIVGLCKRRGFVYQSADIYGGFRSAYDYGPLGSEMLRNVIDAWWRNIVHDRRDVVGIDASILSPPAVWEASGHLANFTDPLVDCRSCGGRFREDQLVESDVCPTCEASDSFTESRAFNLMFKTHAGPVEGAGNDVYLRPETAQGMFVNFANVLNTSRKKPPFGIAQTGKSFRNEITPGNFVFRTREFVQMELEFFVPPDEADHWHQFWLQERMSWYEDLGIDPSCLRFRPHEPDELSHYSSATSDIEYLFPFGWGELEGIANRGDYDLTQHSEHSGARLSYFDEVLGEHVTPHVIEPAAGATRAMMAFLIDAYEEQDLPSGKRTVLHLDHRLAPYKVAVLPLSRKEPLTSEALRIFDIVKGIGSVDYDDTQAIGRRYRRQDEIGTPLCVTVDFDTPDDNAVTIRDRDSMAQERVPIENLRSALEGRLAT